MGLSCYCVHNFHITTLLSFQCPHGLELLQLHEKNGGVSAHVSMPSWAWVVTTLPKVVVTLPLLFQCPHGLELLLQLCRLADSSLTFQCPHGLELLQASFKSLYVLSFVSMPSWAWVVTARMSNILNFSWYFLCIPAIYKCILAYLPIFFNQLSKFLRCESPSTFLGTCLSHHSFIIFLVTNINTLLSGLYLISTGAII